MTAREVIAIIEKDGWYRVNTTGSHANFKHDEKKGRVTVPLHNGDIAKGTLNNILKQAGLK